MRTRFALSLVTVALAVALVVQVFAAQQTFQRSMTIPTWPVGVASTPTLAGVAGTTIDAINEAFCPVFKAPRTELIRGVWFRPGTVTTGGTITIGIYQVSLTTGDPSDTPTAQATNTFITKAITTGDSDDFIYSGAFTADASVTKGDLLAACFINPGSSPASMTFSQVTDSGWSFPYYTLFTGTWAKAGISAVLLLEYDDGAVEIPLGHVAMGTASAGGVNANTVGTGTTPDVIGARLQFPGPVRVDGGWVWVDGDGDFDVYLVDESWDGTSGDALAVASFDANARAGSGANIYNVEFTAGVDLTAATNYRMLVVPTSATTMSVYDYPVLDAEVLGAQPLGANFHLTTAKDPNDDTDFTNYNSGTFRVPWMGLHIAGIGDDVGGAGPTRPPFIIGHLLPREWLRAFGL